MKRSVTIWDALGTLTTRQTRYPTLEAIEAIFQVEGFWRGAISARCELFRDSLIIPDMKDEFLHHVTIDNLEALAEYAKAGCDIRPTTEYKRWLINGMEVVK